MNERFTFVFAALAANLGASLLIFTRVPQNPICLTSSSLTTYAVQSLSISLVLWLIVFGAAWIFAGPVVLRPRQNDSTKLKLLAILCVIGLVIDNLVSYYQSSGAPDAAVRVNGSEHILFGLGLRTICYLLIFCIAVALSFLAEKFRRPGVTPPPRFGRED